MHGYENNLTANQSAFTNGWFHTGDQGRFDTDGYLFITSRIKEIINRGGEKIAPREVDEVLIQHPAIAQAIAFAVPHATLGEAVAAAVVLHEKATVTASEIRDFASARLADFKVPSQVVIVEEIPKGPTGKVQRIGLADKLAGKLQTYIVAPRNAIEQQLAAIWQDVLNINHVGVRDNFYALGADSIAAAVMLTKIASCFNTEIPLASFLRSPTIETLARLLQEQASSMASGVAGAGPALKSDPRFSVESVSRTASSNWLRCMHPATKPPAFGCTVCVAYPLGIMCPLAWGCSWKRRILD